MGSLNAENTAKQELDDSGCVQDASEGENGRHCAQLLDLSDDVLLCILQYLTPRDLKALGHTCPRLGILICDRTLWTKVDARTAPMGQERLKWLLTHCLSPVTTELKITGYANKFSRCLGIQDLHWPVEADQNFIRGTCVGSQEGVDVEHFLLRMWYPHLPRRDIILANLAEQSYQRFQSFAVSPRWPDKAEAEIKTAKAQADKKAAETAASKSGDAAANGDKPGNTVKISSSLGPNSQKSNCSGSPSFSDLKTGSSGQSSKNSGPNSNKLGQNGDHPGTSGENGECFKSWSENMDEYPALFEDDIRDDCKGPQFTLTKRLMRDLRSTCSNLTSLAVEYCNIDYKSTNLRHFPIKLKKLSLRGSRIYNLPLNTSYLGKVQERLPGLEYLDVSECDWFEPASLMPLSKLTGLTELYMRDCMRLTECVAYASLATRYGFRKLRVFDVRGSPLADSEVSALGWLPRLEELYVSPPEDYSLLTEHTHSWSTTGTPHNELDTWEQEEPDYYKIKSPEPEHEPEDKEEEPDERHGDMMISNPWWSHERRIIVIQPNANRQLEEHYPLMQRQPQNEDIWAPPRQGIRIPRPDVEEIPFPMRIPLPPIRCMPGSIDFVAGDIIPRPVRQVVPQEPPGSGTVNPKPVPADPRDDSLLRQGTAIPKAESSSQRPRESGPSNLQAGPAMYRPSSINLHPCPPNPSRLSTTCPQFANPPPTFSAFHGGPAFYRPGPAYGRPGPTNPQAGTSNPQPSTTNPQVGTANPQAGTSHPQPSTKNPQVGMANPQAGTANPQAGTSNPQPGSTNPQPGAGNQQPGRKKSTKILLGATIYGTGPENLHATVRYLDDAPESPEPGPSNPQPGTTHPQAGNSNPQPAPSNPKAAPSNPQAGYSNQRPAPSHPKAGYSNQRQAPSNPQTGYSNQRPSPSTPQAGYSNPGQVPTQPQAGTSNQAGQSNPEKRRVNINDAIDLAKRRRVEAEDEEMQPLNPIPADPGYIPPYSPERCPRLRLEDIEDPEHGAEMHRHPGCVRFRRHDYMPIMHVDLDINRPSTQLSAQVGFNLVSDSALLRFGRAENENINYVHIGRNGIQGPESGSRPDRSNLRILSVTGYRNITDRSLQHLVSAAPYLLHIDFTETSVTPGGVELFKAVRPECEVVYSKFNRHS